MQAKNKAKLLPPSFKESLFKLKIYYQDGGEKTYWSYDFEHERTEFSNREREHYIQMHRSVGYQFFTAFNGFRKQYEHIEKVNDQGKLKRAMIYLNKIYEQYETGFMPMLILQVNTQE